MTYGMGTAADAVELRMAPRGASASFTGDDESAWVSIGEGTYKDVLFSDLFGKSAQTFAVDFEQNTEDPTVYRIKNVYENMDLSEYEGYLTYDAKKATPMVFHVFYDRYAYFDEFDTGVYMTYKNGGTDYTGEVHALMQGTDLLESNTIDAVMQLLPECLCQYRDGNFLMDATFNFNGRTWSNLLGLVYVTGTPHDTLFKGNTKGDFMVTLPNAETYDPDADWTDLGMATYTDAFTESIMGTPTTATGGTWKVKVQRNNHDPELFRLVNPYAAWESPNDDIKYDTENNYYMTFIVREYDGFNLVGIPTFYTGLVREGYGNFAISNQAADAVTTEEDYLMLYYYNPGCLGYMENGVITYTSYCYIQQTEQYLNFYGFFGTFDPYGTFVSANSKGNFRIVMPDAEDGAKAVTRDESGATEYYNLQGVRVEHPRRGEPVIRKNGANAKVIIL